MPWGRPVDSGRTAILGSAIMTIGGLRKSCWPWAALIFPELSNISNPMAVGVIAKSFSMLHLEVSVH